MLFLVKTLSPRTPPHTTARVLDGPRATQAAIAQSTEAPSAADALSGLTIPLMKMNLGLNATHAALKLANCVFLSKQTSPNP